MQSNGTIVAPTGNLILCDMFGHRVLELDPANGRVLRVLLDGIKGRRIDGPNDLVMDAKGGIYVTDPQFTPDQKKSQPGKQVYYTAPDGSARVVIGPGEYDAERRRDLARRQDAVCEQHPAAAWRELRLGGRSEAGGTRGAQSGDRFDSGADGSAVDTEGRYYVATRTGVQIFFADGTAAGTIQAPQYPVSVTFGGRDNGVLYIVGESSVWSIQTKVHGSVIHRE
jgi:gluconolactonase